MAVPPHETRFRRREIVPAAAILVVAFLCLVFGVHNVPVASACPDPVSKIRAQDEALCCHIATRMTEKGGWLTPVFLGRFLLYKPPMLAWLSPPSSSYQARWRRPSWPGLRVKSRA